MKDKFFIDTNILVYTFHPDEPDKQRLSNSIVRKALMDRNACISYQVVQEFINVATKKFVVPLSIEDCKRYFDMVLGPLCEIYAGVGLYHSAMDIMARWKLPFYDTLIIAAALQADCNILFSEDFQHKQKIKSLTIINPFYLR